MRTGSELRKTSCLTEAHAWFLVSRSDLFRRLKHSSSLETNSSHFNQSCLGSKCQRASLHQISAPGSALASSWVSDRRLTDFCLPLNSTRHRMRRFQIDLVMLISICAAKATTSTRIGRSILPTINKSSLLSHPRSPIVHLCRVQSRSPRLSIVKSRKVTHQNISSEFQQLYFF